MSTAETTASSSKTRNFALAFAIVLPVLYVLCDLRGWALFTLHPATGLIEWGQTQPRSGGGPVMYWYGWTATTLIGTVIVGAIATLLPESIARKVPMMLAWLLPILAVPVLVYSLMPWWTR